jgi:hypothetical protein
VGGKTRGSFVCFVLYLCDEVTRVEKNDRPEEMLKEVVEAYLKTLLHNLLAGNEGKHWKLGSASFSSKIRSWYLPSSRRFYLHFILSPFILRRPSCSLLELCSISSES